MTLNCCVVEGKSAAVVLSDCHLVSANTANVLWVGSSMAKITRRRHLTLRAVKNRKRSGWACRWFWWGNLWEREHWGEPGLDGRIILKWIVRKWDVEVWTGLGWLWIGTGVGRL